MFQKYDLIKETRMQISQLAKYYDGVLPSTVAFVFNEQGGYESAIKLDQHSPSTEYPIAATTKHWDKTVAFLVEKKEKPDQNIMIYRKGYPVAQRYYGERSGDWQGRFWGAMLQKIRVATLNLLNFNEDVIYRVFREACNLSSCREGAKIIIADPEEISDAFFPDEKKGVGREINAPIFSMSSNDFVETAKGDGSVIIARDGMIQKVGIFLEPKTHVELTVELSTLLKARGPGGRHESAIKECCACRTALIFIVSQNRSISVLHCGSAIEWEL
jgi:hypothetical protein